MGITRFTLTRPVTTSMVGLTLLVLGALSFARLKIDFLPQVDFPFIGVLVPYPNGVPEQIERDIAKPVEEILATLGNVDEIFSESDARGCFIGVTFDFGRPVDVLRLEVKEKLDHVRRDLPEDVREVFLLTFDSNDIPVLEGRISARSRDLAASYELLERKVIRPLERIDGVGRVQVDGIAPREVSIDLEMEAIKAHNVDVGRLFQILERNNVNVSVGKVTSGGLRYDMRALGALTETDQLRDLWIGDGVRLGDVAEIVEREPEQTYYRRLNGESAVAFIIQKASGANVVDLSRAVNRELERINADPALEGIDVVLFFDQAESIVESLNGLLGSGVMGSLLAIGILYFFLRHVRTTLIISIAIPVSVIATSVFLYLTHRTLNVLTMMGLMLAVGMLVDNAIVVLEAIYRHQLRGARGAAAALAGSHEVGRAVVASTLTSVIVFAPIVLGGGDELIVWLREVGVTISVTLLFSLLVSLTLVPMLTARLAPPKEGEPSRLVGRLLDRYLRTLEWTTFRHPRLTGLVIAPGVFVLSLLLAAATGVKPEPDTERGIRQERLRIEMRFSDNVNLYRADEYTRALESFLLPRTDSLGVANVYSFYQDNRAETTLFFNHSLTEKDMKRLRKWLRDHLPEMAGVRYELGEEEGANQGAKRIEVSIFGEDSELLRELANEAKRRIALVPGLADVRTNSERGSEEIQVVVDREKASRHGVNPGIVAGVLDLTFRGTRLRDLQAADREVPMTIQLDRDDRRNIENLSTLTVGGFGDLPVILEQVARFEFAKSPMAVRRQQQRTAANVTAVYEGEKFNDALDQVRRTMDSFAMPAGYSWSFGREYQQSREQQNDMLINILLAQACVYFVMAALFESLLHPLVIMLCIPFAAVGVIWLLALTNTPLNIMAMIGLVILIGVVVNNGIVLLDHVNTFRRRGASLREAIVEGARERFRPILMTAATTILGLLPLAVGDTAMARAQYYPMARALIGGLASSTLLTLVLLPTYYVLAERVLVRVRQAWARSAVSPEWLSRIALPGTRSSNSAPR